MKVPGLVRIIGIALAMLGLVGCRAAGQTASPLATAVPQRSLPALSFGHGDTAAPLVTSAPATFAPVTPPPATFPPGGDVPAALVGTWTQDNTAGSVAGYFGRIVWVFTADGYYGLYDLLCLRGATTCDDSNPPEGGIADVKGNVLSVSPTTQSVLGPRSYTFEVVRDPDRGVVLLHFFTPDYVDEFELVP